MVRPLGRLHVILSGGIWAGFAGLQRKVKTKYWPLRPKLTTCVLPSQRQAPTELSPLLVAEFQHLLRTGWNVPSLPARLALSLQSTSHVLVSVLEAGLVPRSPTFLAPCLLSWKTIFPRNARGGGGGGGGGRGRGAGPGGNASDGSDGSHR